MKHIDTAEMDGPFANAELVGHTQAGRRDDVAIATKFGLVSHAGNGTGMLDSSPANIRTGLGLTEAAGDRPHRPLHQHRVDPNIPIEDTSAPWPKFNEAPNDR